MAKRFIDTDLFKKRAIRALAPKYKLLLVYLFTDCNHAGIWEVDLEVAGIRLGAGYDEAQTIESLGQNIQVVDGGDKWYLTGFVEFQYGELNEANRAHKSVIDLLIKYNIKEGAHKGLTSPSQGCKDKDMDMVKDKDRDRVEVKVEDDGFQRFWDLYDKKRGRPKCEAKWKRLKPEERAAIMAALPAYLTATPDKGFRKDPLTYLNGRGWEDEIIKRNGVKDDRLRTDLSDNGRYLREAERRAAEGKTDGQW